MNFPIYRKYSNQKVFFKISSETDFEEITLMGSKILHQKINATTYAERLSIFDLIEMKNEHTLESTSTEFESFI